MKRSGWAKRLGAVISAVAAMAFMTASPAMAAADDSFNIGSLYDGCAYTYFHDNGTYSDGATRDDFFTIRDMCADGYSAFARVNVNGTTYAEIRNSNGSGSKVYFDISKNLVSGDYVEIYACLKNGAAGETFYCDRNYHTMIDG